MVKKYLLLFLVLSLSSCFSSNENTKNLEIKDTKQEELKISENEKKEDISLAQFQNSIYSSSWRLNLKGKIASLEKTNSIENENKNIFLKSFIWDYAEAKILQNILCDTDIKNLNCKSIEADFTISSIVDWESNNIINLDNVGVKINSEKLKYNPSFSLKLSYNFVHRISIFKKWYTSYYEKITIKDFPIDREFKLSPELNKYDLYEKIDSSKEYSYDTENFNFVISPDSFTFKDWTKLNWEVEIYLFDIPLKKMDLFTLDMFSKEDFSYLWNRLMNSSTALIRAYKDNKELRIVKPIKVSSNLNKISRKMHLIDLEVIPKNTTLSQDLIKKYYLPFIWNLDNDSWIWVSTDLKLLNSDWDIEFLLY